MANLRILYNNVGDNATLKVPDAYPSMPSNGMQSAGRLARTRLKQIKAAAFTSTSQSSTTNVGGADDLGVTSATISAWIYGGCGFRIGGTAGGAFAGKSYLEFGLSGSYFARTVHHTSGSSSLSSLSASTTQWIFVAAVWDGDAGTVQVFVDSGTGLNAGTAQTANITDFVGGSATALSIYLLGSSSSSDKVARLRYDTRALDSSELTELASHRYAHDGALVDRFSFNDTITGERGNTFTGSFTYPTGPGAHGTTNMTQIKGNWSANTTANMIALLRHNLPASATIRARLYSAVDQGGSTLYDSGTVAPYSGTRTGDYWSKAFYFTEITTARSFLIEVQNGTTAWDVARLVIGSYWSPDKNVSYGLSLSWRDTSFRSRTEGGALVAEPGQIYRSLQLMLPRLTATNRDAVSALLATAGAGRELFVSAFPDNSDSQLEMDHALSGMGNTPAVTHDFATNFAMPLQIEEA